MSETLDEAVLRVARQYFNSLEDWQLARGLDACRYSSPTARHRRQAREWAEHLSICDTARAKMEPTIIYSGGCDTCSHEEGGVELQLFCRCKGFKKLTEDVTDLTFTELLRALLNDHGLEVARECTNCMLPLGRHVNGYCPGRLGQFTVEEA